MKKRIYNSIKMKEKAFKYKFKWGEKPKIYLGV